MIVFLADVGVKENRRSLLCKTSGGDGEIGEIEEPFSRAGLYVGRRRRLLQDLRRKMAK
jgi:hypothetical protein